MLLILLLISSRVAITAAIINFFHTANESSMRGVTELRTRVPIVWHSACDTTQANTEITTHTRANGDHKLHGLALHPLLQYFAFNRSVRRYFKYSIPKEQKCETTTSEMQPHLFQTETITKL
jgi:hypothetical protein